MAKAPPAGASQEIVCPRPLLPRQLLQLGAGTAGAGGDRKGAAKVELDEVLTSGLSLKAKLRRHPADSTERQHPTGAFLLRPTEQEGANALNRTSNHLDELVDSSAQAV